MNEQLESYARQKLKDGMAKLPEEMHKMFKLMYSHKNLDAEINEVIDSMPVDKLDHAMMQVTRSLDLIESYMSEEDKRNA